MPAIMAERRAENHLELDAVSETVKSGEVLPQRNVCRWVKRPQPQGNGWGSAVLCINGSDYAASSFFAEGEHGACWQVIDLRQPGKHYRLTFGPDGDLCDCPHMNYRGCECKHVASVRAALLWLDNLDRAEFERAAAEATIAAAGDPFEG